MTEDVLQQSFRKVLQNSKMVVILHEVVRVHVFVDAATEPALHAVAGCSMTP